MFCRLVCTLKDSLGAVLNGDALISRAPYFVNWRSIVILISSEGGGGGGGGGLQLNGCPLP